MSNTAEDFSQDDQAKSSGDGKNRVQRRSISLSSGPAWGLASLTVIGGVTLIALKVDVIQFNLVTGGRPIINSGIPVPGDTETSRSGPEVSVPADAEADRKTVDAATATTQSIVGSTVPPVSVTTIPSTETPIATTAPESIPDTTTRTTLMPATTTVTTSTTDTTTRTTVTPTTATPTTATPTTASPTTAPPTTARPSSRAKEFYAEPFLFDLDKDEPGGSYSWFRPPDNIASSGFGANGFWFTLAYGGSDTIDNFARWDFDNVPLGTYDMQVYVPAEWATARIEYLIWVDENDDKKFSTQENRWTHWLNQAQVYGWQSLGEFALEGAVRIEVHDTRSSDDWRVDGVVNSRLAVDAMRLVEVVGS